MPSRAETFEQQKLTGGIITVEWEFYIWCEEPGVPLMGTDSMMELGMEEQELAWLSK